MLIILTSNAQQAEITPHEPSKQLLTGTVHSEVRLLAALQLRDMRIAEETIAELSGLGWSEDDQLLYALSDQGLLVRLQPEFNGDWLRDVSLLDAMVLRDALGEPLAGLWTDSEGLQLLHGADGIADNTRFLISFERKPRICQHDARGWQTSCQRLPTALTQPRHPNRALESVALHPQWGILSAAEQPLPGTAEQNHRLYTLEGHSWQLTMQLANGRLTGLDVQPDGGVLVLEQLQTLTRFGLAVRQLYLDKEALLQSRQLLKIERRFFIFPGSAAANFEGIAAQGTDRFFLISDDNGWLPGETLLLQFQIRQAGP